MPARTIALATVAIAINLAALLSFAQEGASAPILRSDITYATKSILAFEQMQGQTQWIESSRQRIQGATWQFRPNGTFIFLPANARDDLFPLAGKFRCESLVCKFSGISSSQIGSTGGAACSVEGRIDFTRPEPRLTMTQITGMINAAVVNEIRFSQGSTTEYKFTVSLAQIRKR